MAALRQQADHHVLAMQRRLGLDAQVVAGFADLQPRAPALGQAVFGDIQLGAGLDHVDHPGQFRRGQLVVVEVVQIAVHPQADAHALLVALDVHVAGLLADRIEQDRLVDRHQIGADLVVQFGGKSLLLTGQGLGRRRHIAVAFAADIEHRPQAAEVVAGHQHLVHAGAGVHLFEHFALHVRVVRGDHQAAITLAHRQQAVMVEKGAREALEELLVQLLEQLVGLGVADTQALGQGPVGVDVVDIDMAQDRVQHRLLENPRLGARHFHHLFVDQAEVDQRFRGVAAEIDQAELAGLHPPLGIPRAHHQVGPGPIAPAQVIDGAAGAQLRQ